MKLLSVSDLPDGQKSLEVEIDGGELSVELDGVYRKLAEAAEMPGFRKGKVPRAVLEQKFGDEALKEALEHVVPKAYDRAVDESGLKPVESPRFEEVKYEKGERLRFKAVVQVKPDVALPAYNGIELSRHPVAVTEEAVENEVKTLLSAAAELETVARPAAPGDIVQFDYRGYVDGEALPDVGAEKFEVEVGGGRLVGKFEDELRGLSADQDAAFDVPYPDDYHHPKLRGRNVRFQVHVHAVKEKRLPELTDALAKARFGVETALEFKVKVREALGAAARHAEESDLRDQLLRHLASGASFAVPPALVEKRVVALIQEHMMDARRRGLTVPLDEVSVGTMRTQLEPLAREQLKAYLVLDAIATNEGIQATDDEFEAAVVRLAESAGQAVERIRAALARDGRHESLRSQIRDDKTIEFLLAAAAMRTA